MKAVCFIVLKFVLSFFRKRMSIQMENAAPRYKLKAYKRKDRKPKSNQLIECSDYCFLKYGPAGRMLYTLLSQQLWFPGDVKSSGNIGQSYAETANLGVHQSIAK